MADGADWWLMKTMNLRVTSGQPMTHVLFTVRVFFKPVGELATSSVIRGNKATTGRDGVVVTPHTPIPLTRLLIVGLFTSTMAAQLPDRILLNGECHQLYSNPLEYYWILSNKTRPMFCTTDTCRRGYVATWEIRNDQLFIKSIEGAYQRRTFFLGRENVRYSLRNIFPRAGNRIAKATWYSGKLRIPKGKMTAYDDGYDARFEQELIVTIEKGNVVKMVTIDYTNRVLIVTMQPKI